MMRPRKMKRIELTVLKRDADRALEYLGRRGVLQIGAADRAETPAVQAQADASGLPSAADTFERIRDAAAFLSVSLREEPAADARLPEQEDAELAESICGDALRLRDRETATAAERDRLSDALSEARSFANLNAPFSDLESLSYLTLRVGRIEPKSVNVLRDALGDRGVVVPLGGEGRILAAASRKGRFALDGELAKASFAPIRLPEGFTGVPAELLAGLEARVADADAALAALDEEKAAYAKRFGPALERLGGAYLMAVAVERLKSSLEATRTAYRLGGWIAASDVERTVADLERLTDGRVSVVSYDPSEVESVVNGEEKVPVSLDHGRFVRGFERLVFSYGAPLYGTIDPTPFVAVSFTILFGLMFGDLGQGSVLLLLGLLAGKGRPKALARFSRFAPALVAVGIASMVVGLLDGEVFAMDGLLVGPTRALTAALTGTPADRVLHLMPERGHLGKIFAFFGFTMAVGIVLNSIGLVINIINQFSLGRRERALFAKTGLSGALLFWYAVFMAIRTVLGGSLHFYDALGIGIPVLGLFLGSALYRLAAGERPVFEHGPVVFFVEGFVEVLESASYYLSNTVSFLRVGAFALSHAVLAFIVFELSDMVGGVPAGPVFSAFVSIIGNAIIILLEGLIVAIQTVRLQYYEFFSKFFTETGVEFSPFRFSREVQQ